MLTGCCWTAQMPTPRGASWAQGPEGAAATPALGASRISSVFASPLAPVGTAGVPSCLPRWTWPPTGGGAWTPGSTPQAMRSDEALIPWRKGTVSGSPQSGCLESGRP